MAETNATNIVDRVLHFLYVNEGKKERMRCQLAKFNVNEVVKCFVYLISLLDNFHISAKKYQ